MTVVSPSVFDTRFVLSCFQTKTDRCNTCNWEDKTFQYIMERTNHSIGDIEET